MSINPPPADESAEAAAVRPPRPRTVTYFLYAMAARGVLSVLAALSLYGARGEVRTQLADANKAKGWTNADLNHNVDLVLRAAVLNAGVMLILLGLVAKFVWDGKSWARWIYLAVIVLLARDQNSVLGFFGYHHLLPRVLSGFTGLFGLASVVLLFVPASLAYFRPVAGAAPGGLFGAFGRSRGLGGPAAGGVARARTTNPAPVRRSRGATPTGEVSLTKPAKASRPPASRGKSRQPPPKRPGAQ